MILNDINEYLNSLNLNNKPLSELFDKIKNFQNKHFIPLVSFEVASFLYMISSLQKPLNVLEIGFGSGASGIFILKGFPETKRFISLEKDKNRFERGLELLKNLKLENKIELIKADAFEYLIKNEETFDFIFLDAVKREYRDYLEPLKKILNYSGVLICDNILFNSRVVQEKPEKKYESGVKNLKQFNNELAEDIIFNTLFLNIGDGLSISIKNKESNV